MSMDNTVEGGQDWQDLTHTRLSLAFIPLTQGAKQFRWFKRRVLERPESWVHPYVSHSASVPRPYILCLTQISILHMLPTSHKGGQSRGVDLQKSIIITAHKYISQGICSPYNSPSGSSSPGSESTLFSQDSPSSRAAPGYTAMSSTCIMALVHTMRKKGFASGPQHLCISIEFIIMSPKHFCCPTGQLDKQALKIILKLRRKCFQLLKQTPLKIKYSHSLSFSQTPAVIGLCYTLMSLQY